MAKSFTKSVSIPSHLAAIDHDQINAQLRLETKSKMLRFICFEATTDTELQICDLTEMFLKREYK